MGLLFNSASENVRSPGNYARGGTDHTVSFWARLDTTGATRRPFGNTGAWEMRTNTGSALTSDLLQSGTLGVATLTVGTYHHLMVVQDVGNTDRYFYVDGVLVNSVLTATFTGTQTGLMTIGTSAAFLTQGWLGALDDFRIYNRVLGLEEAQTLYTCRGTDGMLDNIEHWWPMDEGAEGATTTGLTDVIAGLNLTTVNGTPVYNYDAGIRQRRMA